MLKRALVVVALVVIWGSVTEPLRAEVEGILTDAEGVPIKEATLTINRSGGSTTIKTDEDGLFNANELEVTSGADAELQFKSLRFSGKVDIQAQWGPSALKLVLRGFSLATVTATPTWNIWPSLEGDREIRRAPEVTVGTNYTVHFDLARVKYSDSIGAIEADPVLAAYLAHGNRKLWVKPLIQGQGLRLLDTTPSEHEITLEKLQSPQPGEGLSLRALSKRFAALAIEVPVAAEAPGKSIVGLALMDRARRQVVGLVSVEIVVKAKSSEGQAELVRNTGSGSGSEALHAAVGNQALFRLLSGSEASLGIGLFNLGGLETVVVVNEDGDFRSWTPRRSIREYVDDIDPKHFGLNRQLKFIHCPSWASLDCEEDYSQVASFFSQILFSDPTEKGRGEAKLAKEDLQKLGESKDEIPIVSVGYFNGAGTVLPIPLGLLGVTRKTAKDKESNEETVLLGTLATVTQPLPITQLPPPGGCAEDFTAILPSSLGLEGPGVRPDFDVLLRPYRKLARRRSTHKDLKAYFEEKPNPEKREGLLLLAHHVDGFLSFDAGFKQAYLAENMERDFAPGSVAVLIGCSVGGLDSLNRTMPLISTLNERGIDAMILSPFGVNAQLGARFAVHFAAEIEEARLYGRSPTLLEAFQSTIQRTRGDASITPFLNELNEFLIAGAGDLKLCPKKVVAQSAAASVVPSPPPAGQPQPTDPPAVDPDSEEPPTQVTSQRDFASCGCGRGRGRGGRLDTDSGGVKPGGQIGPFQRDFGGYGWGCCCCN